MGGGQTSASVCQEKPDHPIPFFPKALWVPQHNAMMSPAIFFRLENVTKVVITRDEVINGKKRSYFALAMIIKLSELILVISF